MFFKQLLQSSTARLVLIALVLCGITLVGTQSMGHAKAEVAQSVTSSPVQQYSVSAAQVVPGATSGVVRIQCPPNSVGMNVNGTDYGDVGIYSPGCPGAGDITSWQFTGDSKKTNQILAILLSAQARGKLVNIFYDPNDTAGLVDLSRRRTIALGVDN